MPGCRERKPFASFAGPSLEEVRSASFSYNPLVLSVRFDVTPGDLLYEMRMLEIRLSQPETIDDADAPAPVDPG